MAQSYPRIAAQATAILLADSLQITGGRRWRSTVALRHHGAAGRPGERARIPRRTAAKAAVPGIAGGGRHASRIGTHGRAAPDGALGLRQLPITLTLVWARSPTIVASRRNALSAFPPYTPRAPTGTRNRAQPFPSRVARKRLGPCC